WDFFLYSKRLHNLYSGFTHYRNYRAAKKNLFQFLGKERYDEFQEIRHEDEKSKLPKRVFNDFER
ncbi:hypothetical protein, partial [Streptococcus suis]|uniref:hypothetical protein n=1 Tax=Streptococcus suis TaxID=1307 RepID=UPI003756E120